MKLEIALAYSNHLRDGTVELRQKFNIFLIATPREASCVNFNFSNRDNGDSKKD